ncbi:conjugal transfer protein TraD [Desmospora sp. 8437]|nr:conjugal transfer protein TraD [Desmospora sp. 8437]
MGKWLAKQEEMTILGWFALLGLIGYFAWDKYLKPWVDQTFFDRGSFRWPSLSKLGIPFDWIPDWLPDATTVGILLLLLLIGYVSLKGYQIHQTQFGKAIRITPREGMKVDEKQVAELATKMNTVRRRLGGRVQKGRVWLRWVIHRDAKQGKIHVWLVTPMDQIARVRGLLENSYPDAELHIEHTVPLPKGKKGEGGHLKLVRNKGEESAFGIQESTNQMGGILWAMNQGSWIDIRFSPENRKRLTKPGQRLVQKLTRGKKEQWTMRTREDRKKIEAATDRYLGHTAFSVSISLWDSKNKTSSLAGQIYSSFRLHNALKLNRYLWLAAWRNAVSWKWTVPLPWRRLVLSDSELANFFMFPDPEHQVHERLVRLAQGQRQLRKDEFHEGYTVGTQMHPFLPERPIKFPVRQFVWHPVVAGATGSGKGAFITTFAEEFLQGWAKDPTHHAGWTFVDPHRSTILKVITLLMKMEKEGCPIDWNRVHYFYLGPNDHPAGLNLLYKREGDDIDQLTEQAAELIKTAYPGELSRTSVLIENGIATLLSDNRTRTIAELPRLFQDKAFRNGILDRVKNPAVRDFWANEDRKQSQQKQKKDTNIDALLTRLNPFFRNMAMQRMFGQSKNILDARCFFEEGHIVLVDMNGVSPATFQLAGGMITNRYHNEAVRRVSGRPHYLWIDEAPLLKKVPTFTEIVQEDRKRGLGLAMFTQDVDKLDKDLTESLKVNSGIVVSLNPGSAGARKAAELLGGSFTPEYLSDLKTLEAAAWVRSVGTVTVKLKPPVYYLNGKATAEDSPEENEAKEIALEKAMELQKRSGEGTPVKKVDEEILTRYQQIGG